MIGNLIATIAGTAIFTLAWLAIGYLHNSRECVDRRSFSTEGAITMTGTYCAEFGPWFSLRSNEPAQPLPETPKSLK